VFRQASKPRGTDEGASRQWPAHHQAAELLRTQADAVPVFMKQGINRWKYVGMYRAVDLDTSADAIFRESRRTGRTDISCVLHLARE
jgi:hypothetical protein